MACSARHVNANEPLLLAAAHNLSILRAAAQDKAATAWTLTSSLQALGPIQGGEVIGIALDQGDYPVQVGIRAPDRGAPPPSHALCGHATRRLALRRRPLLRLPLLPAQPHVLRRRLLLLGLLLPRRQGHPPDQRHPRRGAACLQRLGRRGARGELWRQGLPQGHTSWLPGHHQGHVPHVGCMLGVRGAECPRIDGGRRRRAAE